MRPDDTGDCFLIPFDQVATNDVWDRMVIQCGAALAAQPTLRAGIHGGFTVPKNYVGNANVVIVWSASVTAGAVVWDFDYRAVSGSDTESLDQTTQDQQVTATTAAAPSAAWEKMETTIALTSANFVADDEITYFLARDGADGSDAKAGAAFIFQALFQYTDV